MPPLPQDVAGELGKYVDLLKRSLEQVRAALREVVAQIRLENVEAQLLPQLTAAEQAALEPFTQRLNLAELTARRDLLAAQRDALAKAIGILEARLGGGV